jgi:hypothetical protein
MDELTIQVDGNQLAESMKLANQLGEHLNKYQSPGFETTVIIGGNTYVLSAVKVMTKADFL